ncbi:MAG: hypothetical protein HQ546_08115 [Planctomycetes bacterium]|nr:hypothetical protein [Planctomycetota bacterium]
MQILRLCEGSPERLFPLSGPWPETPTEIVCFLGHRPSQDELKAVLVLILDAGVLPERLDGGEPP